MNHEAQDKYEEQKVQADQKIDKNTLSVLVSALKQHNAAKDLNEELLEDICIEAFALGKINDFEWLSKKLQEVTGEEISLDQSEQSSQEIKEQLTAAEQLQKIQISQPIHIESEEDMKDVLLKHEIWMNSVLNPKEENLGGRANLRGANLSGFNLSGVNLSCADFRGAQLIGTLLNKANLSNAWLQGANFQGASLKGAKLKKAKLEKTDFRDADLSDVDFEHVEINKALINEGTKRTLPTSPSEKPTFKAPTGLLTDVFNDSPDLPIH